MLDYDSSVLLPPLNSYFSSDEKTLVTGGNKTLEVWNTETR